jgi:glycosyltransferase involved in cell wall biosynthesis
VALIGVLAPWKGQDVFLRAIANLVEEFPFLQAEIVGDEIYATKGHAGIRRSLEKLSAELGLVDRVRFTGWVEKLWPVLSRTDVVVHASTEPEPFGRVLIEAMAAGKPVVATHAGGVPEIVESGSTGLLVPAKDPGALARANGALLSDPDRRRRMGAAGRARVEKHFTIEQQIRSIESIYRRIASQRPPRQKS